METRGSQTCYSTAWGSNNWRAPSSSVPPLLDKNITYIYIYRGTRYNARVSFPLINFFFFFINQHFYFAIFIPCLLFPTCGDGNGDKLRVESSPVLIIDTIFCLEEEKRGEIKEAPVRIDSVTRVNNGVRAPFENRTTKHRELNEKRSYGLKLFHE